MRGVLMALVGMVLLAGCGSLPQATRTAVIYDIKFEEHMMPADLTIHAGDEVRWVNFRTLPVMIDIPGLNADMLSCESGFSGMFGGVQEVTKLGPNQSASLCFKTAIVLSYNGRMRSAAPGGMQIEPGTIRVVSPR